MSFADLTLDLGDHEGMTIITGPNGSGKSTLFEAVTWGLFGRTIRSLPVKKLRYRHASDTSPCLVKLVVEHNGEEFVIERHRTVSGKNELYASKLNLRGTPSALQQKLEEFLGLDYDYFVAVSMFGGDIASFCSLTDSERRKLFRKLLSMDVYAEAHERAKQEALDNSQIVQDMNEANYNLNEELEDMEAKQKELQKKNAGWSRAKGLEILEIYEEIGRKEIELAKLEKDYDEFLERRYSIMQEYERELEEYETARKRVDKELTEKTDALSDMRADLTTVRYVLKENREKLENYRKINRSAEPGNCPTCGQPLPHSKKAKKLPVQGLEKSVKEGEVEEARLRSNINRVKERVDKLRAKRDSYKRPEKPDTSRQESFKLRCSMLEREMKRAVKDRYKVRKSDNPYREILDDLNDRISKAKNTLRENSSKAKKAAMDSYIANYWQSAFHYKGIPSYLLDSIIPKLTEKANVYAREISGGRLMVEFSTQAKGDKFSIEPSYVDGADSYVGSSKGERLRVDLCVLLAIRDVIESSRRSSMWPQLFMDELFDGLDEEGIQDVVRLMKTHFNESSIFIITHDEALKSQGDHVIQPRKSGTSSILVSN